LPACEASFLGYISNYGFLKLRKLQIWNLTTIFLNIQKAKLPSLIQILVKDYELLAVKRSPSKMDQSVYSIIIIIIMCHLLASRSITMDFSLFLFSTILFNFLIVLTSIYSSRSLTYLRLGPLSFSPLLYAPKCAVEIFIIKIITKLYYEFN